MDMAASTYYLDVSTQSGRVMNITVPTFYLYGEPHKSVEDGFVHAESLADRSRPNEWTIRPHSHEALFHIFFLSEGGGSVLADGRRHEVLAPCVILVPATLVHGFDWEEDTSGSVITLATSRLAGLAWLAPETALLLNKFDILPLAPAQAARVSSSVEELMQELSWSRIGHDAIVQATLLTILVIALREMSQATHADPSEERVQSVVARLRERIDDRFRLREPVAAYAKALGTSETALRAACARIANTSPAQMLDDRALLEARRGLLYSNLSVAQIAYATGFSDPAYFSRFFSRHMGVSPRQYRERWVAARSRDGQSSVDTDAPQ